MYRYIAVVWDIRQPSVERSALILKAAVAAQSNEWSIAYDRPGILVAHKGARTNGGNVRCLRNGTGVILGNIFRREHTDYSSRPAIHLDHRESQSVVDSGGQHLIDRFWGAYVAIIYDEKHQRHFVVRDPSANLGCYQAKHEGADIVFSHLEECIRFLPLSCAINRDYLRRWLVFSGLQCRDSGLDNVVNVIGGERLTLSGGATERTHLWNPVDIAKKSRFEDPNKAAEELRTVVQTTIDAWASCYEDITHQLSGGLDSSIVAGCLAQSPSRPRVRYLNISADVGFDEEPLHISGVDKKLSAKLKAIAGTGDERYFARLVADRWKVPLLEKERYRSMDLARLWQAPLMPTPPMLYTVMELEDNKIELASKFGTQAFFSGLAGDSVFLATIQPLPAMDYAYVHGLNSHLWQHVMATATLSKDSVWTVLQKVLRHGILRRPYRSPVNVLTKGTMLREEVIQDLCEHDFGGYWEKMAYKLPPGKQLHLAGITGHVYDDYIFASGRHVEHVEPLHSQPISELALQIPTYTVLTGGISRGLARRAFGDLLPAEIRKRQVKGTGNPFYQHIVRQNMGLLRDHLLDGRLVNDGYLDRRELMAFLCADEPVFETVQAGRLLRYLSAEIWLQQWTDLRYRIAA